MSKLVQIVTIKDIEKLFKNGEEATNIELITFEENGFEVVSQKGLYEIGDLAVYIQPDSCVPNNDLFKSFVEPNGDISKSKLGKIEGTPARVRAIKFNFTKESSVDKVFSNGILLPQSEVIKYLRKDSEDSSVFIEDYDLEKELGIYKYEEPEVFDKGPRRGKTLGFPTGIYKTDEENINNVWDKIQFPIELVGTVKADGCLPYFQKVNMWDGTSKKIYHIEVGDIVQGYCHKTNKIVPSKVTAKKCNGSTDYWYSISTNSSINNVGRCKTKIFCTGNHKFFSENSYVEASKLNIGDSLIKTIKDYNLSDDIIQILTGKLLGDGSLDTHNANKWAMTFGHCEEQLDYLLYLRDLLGDFVTDNIDNRTSGFGSNMFRSRTRHSFALNNIFSEWLKTGTRQIPDNIKLTPLILCFWYLDDGNLRTSKKQKYSVVFSICSFNDESVKNLDKALKEYGFNNYTFFKNKGYNYLRLNYLDTIKLMEDIHTLVPECMQYKLPKEFRDKFKKPDIKPVEYKYIPIESYVSNIEIIPVEDFAYKTSMKYDIETETSNFFSGETLIHNSSITIGFTEKDGGFICSRNLRLPLEVKEKVGTRKKTLLEKLMFWKRVDLNIYENKPNTSNAFVAIGLPYLETLMSEGLEGFVLRGELCGEGVSKGSGNKNNKNAKEKPNIKFFGVDRVDSNGIARKMEYVKYGAIVDTYKFPTVEEVFNKTFNSKEELVKECEDYFKKNLVEGIVVRTLDSRFSAKFMNNEYDSKK